jgi:hypothetical protein
MMEEEFSTDQLRRQAAETILEASSLTDELTDDEARLLIAWCLSQGEAAADALSASVDMDSLTAEDAREMLTQRVAPVRRLMRAINVLAGERHDLSPHRVFNKLEAIRSLAEELPVPGGVAVTDTALAELAAWQTGFDNGAFVGAILYLVQGMPVGEIETGW